ncbi:MAG: diacylglycerol kinase family protein [Desulfobacterales bacterium]|nr:diacylglycerol kinase family protein [Desulfobacterales bacterium]
MNKTGEYSRSSATFKPEDSGYNAFKLSPNIPLRAGVISNPSSGGNKKGLREVNKIISRHPQVLHLEATTVTDTLTALKEFARNGINLVVINGGDGTVQTVLTAMFFWKPFKNIPLLALLRGGTDSIIARDSGLRGARDQALTRLLNWVSKREGPWRMVQRTVMKADVPALDYPLYGMIFGAAVIYEASEFCHRNLHAKGVGGEWAPGLTAARYVLGVIRGEATYRQAVPISIRTDQGLNLKNDFLMVLITTVDRLFFGLRPFWGVEKAPLHVTLIHDRPEHMAQVFSLLAFGKASRYRKPEYGYFSHNANEVRLQISGGFALDGQLHPPSSSGQHVVITNGAPASFLIG